MVHCTCGKAIEKVPEWLSIVDVEFVCNNCPNRHTKNIVFANFETSAPTEAKIEEAQDLEKFDEEEEA
jgi:hypothetical protein